LLASSGWRRSRRGLVVDLLRNLHLSPDNPHHCGGGRKNMAAPFVLVLPNGAIGGYYTLSATALKLGELPDHVARRLPRYPLVPATLLGRLAADRRWQGQGYGRFLLADALHRAVRSEIASFAVIVDAKDEAARRLYERESFLGLPDRP
jgi:GNAT superfamily N-acetyltransferase